MYFSRMRIHRFSGYLGGCLPGGGSAFGRGLPEECLPWKGRRVSALGVCFILKQIIEYVFFLFRKYFDPSFHFYLQVFTDSDQFLSRQSRCGRFTLHDFYAASTSKLIYLALHHVFS